MDRDTEDVDRVARGRRIFEALRRGTDDGEPDGEPDDAASSAAQSSGGENRASVESQATPDDPSPSEPSPTESVAPGEPPAESSPVAQAAPEVQASTPPAADAPPGGAGEPETPPAPGAHEPASDPPAEPPRAADDAPDDGVAAAPPPDQQARNEPPEDEQPQDTPPAPSLPGAADLKARFEAPVPAAPPSDGPSPTPAPAPTGEAVESAEVPDLPPTPDAPSEPAAVAVPAPLPRVVAIANQKGGVGKTTTAVNLGAALAELGYRVLIVDLDPQGNATTGLGIDIRNLATSVYDAVMSGEPLEDCVEPTSVRNLFVAPSNMDLAGAEIELVPVFSRELKLRRAIESVKDDYDYILIDCPPSLGLLTVNGLAAADDVVVPIQCEYYALEGLGQLVNNVALVRSNLNPVLDIRGIILTMYDARTKLADQVVDEVRTHFGTRVYQTVVPRTVRLSEAPSFGQPIIVYDPSSRGAEAYRQLATELAGGPKEPVPA